MPHSVGMSWSRLILSTKTPRMTLYPSRFQKPRFYFEGCPYHADPMEEKWYSHPPIGRSSTSGAPKRPRTPTPDPENVKKDVAACYDPPGAPKKKRPATPKKKGRGKAETKEPAQKATESKGKAAPKEPVLVPTNVTTGKQR